MKEFEFINITASVIEGIVSSMVIFAFGYSLRPRLKISLLQRGLDYFAFSVQNKSYLCDVNNIKFEICVLSQCRRFTYHLELDKDVLLILKRKGILKQYDNERIIKSFSVPETTLRLLCNFPEGEITSEHQKSAMNQLRDIIDNGGKIRIRCIASSVTFKVGRVFEEILE